MHVVDLSPFASSWTIEPSIIRNNTYCMICLLSLFS